MSIAQRVLVILILTALALGIDLHALVIHETTHALNQFSALEPLCDARRRTAVLRCLAIAVRGVGAANPKLLALG